MTSVFYFHCSEVAACIGKNQYKKQWEALDLIFQRIDNSSYYKKYVQLQQSMGKNIITVQDKVKNLKELGLQSAIDTFLKEDISTSGNLCGAVDTFTYEIQQKETQIKKNKRKLNTMYSEQFAKENNLKKQLEDVTQNQPVVHDVFGPMPVLPIIAPDDASIILELEQTQKATKSLAEQISHCNQQSENMKVAKEELIRQKHCLFGHKQEDLLVAKLGNVSQNNAERYDAILGQCKLWQWGLCGRIDGFQNGELIEIKNRKTRLFDPLPVYDVIQVQCYLHLLKLPKGKLIQSLSLGNNEFETQETVISFDNSLFFNTIIPELNVFIQTLENFCQDTLLQCQFYNTADNKKSILFNKMLAKYRTKII